MKRVQLVQYLIKEVGVEFLEERGYMSVLNELRDDLINEAVLDKYVESNHAQTLVIDGKAVVVLGKNDEFVNKEYQIRNTKTVFVANQRMELPEAEVMGMELLRKYALPMFPELRALVDNFQVTEEVIEKKEEKVLEETKEPTSEEDKKATLALLDEIAGEGMIEDEKVEEVQPVTKGKTVFHARQSSGTIIVDGVEIPSMYYNNKVAEEMRSLPKGKTDVTALLKKNVTPVIKIEDIVKKVTEVLNEDTSKVEVKEEPKEEYTPIIVSSSGDNKGGIFKNKFGSQKEEDFRPAFLKKVNEDAPQPTKQVIFKKAPSNINKVEESNEDSKVISVSSIKKLSLGKKAFNVGEAFYIENGMLIDVPEEEIPYNIEDAGANLVAIYNGELEMGDDVDENELEIAIKNSLDDPDFIDNHGGAVLDILEKTFV